MSREQELVQELRKNEHILHIISLEDLKREWEESKGVIKSIAQHTSPALDLITVKNIISEFGIGPAKVVIKSYAGKEYVIFKGYPGNRRIIKGTRYLTSHPQVVKLAIGPKGILKSAKGGFAITVVLSVGIEVFDYFFRDASALHEMLGTVTADLIKIGLATLAGAAVGLIVGSAAVIGTSAAAPFLIAISVGVIAGVALDHLDRRFGVTRALILGYKNIGIELNQIRTEFNRGFLLLERKPWLIRCLFGPCNGSFDFR